jgi:hypothetical protein
LQRYEYVQKEFMFLSITFSVRSRVPWSETMLKPTERY